MRPYLERIKNGILTENPVLILMLGMCPTLAVTTSAINGLGMGVSTMLVLIFSNTIISALRNVIPDQVRLPAYIVITASLVTVVDLLMQAYTPSLYGALGIYIPLIVVNCIILGRAEAYASKVTPDMAAFDGLGMGLGFTIALTVIGLVREFIGAGTAFGHTVFPEGFEPVGIFVKAPGAFLVIGFIIAIMNALHIYTHANRKVEGCDGCCATCTISHGELAAEKEAGAAGTPEKPAERKFRPAGAKKKTADQEPESAEKTADSAAGESGEKNGEPAAEESEEKNGKTAAEESEEKNGDLTAEEPEGTGKEDPSADSEKNSTDKEETKE